MAGAQAQRVEALAESAKLPLPPANVAQHQQRLREFEALIAEWEAIDLAFRFEDGVFSYAQVPALYLPRESRR